jgi:SET family sugar efflux transporter-like MFS transporter
MLLPLRIADLSGGNTVYVGAFATALSCTEIVTSVGLGRLSDRFPRPYFLAVVNAWISAGLLLVGTLDQLWLIFVVGVGFLGCFNLSAAQLMAMSAGSLDASAERRVEALTRLRSGYSFGYVVGPLIAAILLSKLSPAMVLACMSFTYVSGALVVLVAQRRRSAQLPRKVTAGDHGALDDSSTTRPIVMVAILAGLCLTLPSTAIQSTYGMIYAVREIGVSPGNLAPIFAVGPALELILIPAAAYLVARLGGLAVLGIGGIAASIGLVILASADNLAMFGVAQCLNATVIACIVGVGPGVVQQYGGRGLGFSSSLFFAARTAGALLGSGGFGFLSGATGLRSAFAYAGGVCGLGAGVFWLLAAHRRHERLAIKARGSRIRQA